MQLSYTKSINSGFTLVELLVVIAIAAIFAAIAAPSFSDFIHRTRLQTTASQITGDLNRARSEAIKRNSRVLFCSSNATGTNCVNGTLYHSSGWLVCYDTNADSSCDTSTDALPNPIVRHEALSQMTLTLSRADASTTPIIFYPNGTQGSAAVSLTLHGSWSSATDTDISVNIAATGNISQTP